MLALFLFSFFYCVDFIKTVFYSSYINVFCNWLQTTFTMCSLWDLTDNWLHRVDFTKATHKPVEYDAQRFGACSVFTSMQEYYTRTYTYACASASDRQRGKQTKREREKENRGIERCNESWTHTAMKPKKRIIREATNQATWFFSWFSSSPSFCCCSLFFSILGCMKCSCEIFGNKRGKE